MLIYYQKKKEYMLIKMVDFSIHYIDTNNINNWSSYQQIKLLFYSLMNYSFKKHISYNF